MKSIPEYGDLMTVREFQEGVASTCFTDYDGHGYLATETEMSDIKLYPSISYAIISSNPQFTHVVWFNK